MTDTVAIYLDRRQYFFLLHELKTLKKLFETINEMDEGKTDFNTIKKMTEIINSLQNNKYKKHNLEICNEILEKLQDYNIIDNNE